MAEERKVHGIDELKTEVHNLRRELNETVQLLAEHVHGLKIGDIVYVLSERNADGQSPMGTVKGLGAREAFVVLGGEVLMTRVRYDELFKSGLGSE